MAANNKDIAKKDLSSVKNPHAPLTAKKLNLGDASVKERLQSVKEAQNDALQRKNVTWNELNSIRVRF